MKTFIVLIIMLAFLAVSCAAPPPAGTRHRPRRPYPGAAWIHGHRASDGHWIPGHWK